MESNKNSSVESLLRSIEEQKMELAKSENELKGLLPALKEEIGELRRQASILNKKASEIEDTVSRIASLGSVATRRQFGNSYRPTPNHTRENCPDTAVGGCIHHADSC